MKEKLLLQVPASTANLGVGFDSIGMALDKYLTIEAKVIEGDSWRFVHEGPNLEGLPTNSDHYMYQIAHKVASKFDVTLPNLEIKMRSEIPLARGLGSSASALVASLYITNFFTELELSKYELLQIATEIEGHPDNVAPTIYGGLVVGYYNSQKNTTDISYIDTPKVDVVLTIPSYELRTEDARNVLPDAFNYQEAVQYSAISNTMISALIQHDYKLAGKLMMQDGFHEQFRSHLVKEMAEIKEIGARHHAYATVLSGAGPTMLTLINKEDSGAFVRELKQAFKDCQTEFVTINEAGVKAKVVYEDATF
ncbi:homoserine kinase [Staphylococcus massiliensis]|uniref:homoserine kinase n=1 Tax=Staphylococcus massiliensis TaxID=555791 RepID=UPI0002EB9CCE|nr:homoserine kinase [Staphylococcus massiliensis]MCG3398663.1 homoserine kinase [Staphylococcus massiliensis]MCG3401225.1 homoserine kinase [Staphylococcus massiliensis]MCG3412598.1 homoserine kinase [Staphylococcus massiliensis]POA01039.1 homoserine kinase [Staphylococcus massiliensis CCUG 55927]